MNTQTEIQEQETEQFEIITQDELKYWDRYSHYNRQIDWDALLTHDFCRRFMELDPLAIADRVRGEIKKAKKYGVRSPHMTCTDTARLVGLPIQDVNTLIAMNIFSAVDGNRRTLRPALWNIYFFFARIRLACVHYQQLVEAITARQAGQEFNLPQPLWLGPPEDKTTA